MTVRESINSIKDFLICTQPCSAMRGGDASRVMQARCDVESVDLTSVALYGGGLSGGAMPHIVAAFRIFVPLDFDFIRSVGQRFSPRERSLQEVSRIVWLILLPRDAVR